MAYNLFISPTQLFTMLVCADYVESTVFRAGFVRRIQHQKWGTNQIAEHSLTPSTWRPSSTAPPWPARPGLCLIPDSVVQVYIAS